MTLHIWVKPYGNGSVYVGTPEQLKKRYNDMLRRWRRSEPLSFLAVHGVQVQETGCRYCIYGCADGRYGIYERNGAGTVSTGYAYKTLGAALNRYQKMTEV